MKHKRTVLALSVLATIGIIAFFVLQVNQPTFHSVPGGTVFGRGSDTGFEKKAVDPWQAWVEKQTAEKLKNLSAAYKKQGARSAFNESEWRSDIQAEMTKHANLMKEKYPSPAAMETNGDGLSTGANLTIRKVPLEKYTGPQTVEALMDAFDEKYDRPYLAQVDEKYPRAEWLAMLLDKGVMFGDYSDYSLFMNDRWNLVSFEENGDWRQWRGETFDNWEIFKGAYIDRTIWEEQQIYAARQSDPSVFGGLFTGPDKRTYLPGRANRVYVQREGRSASFHGAPLTQKQQWDIMLQGKHPEGYEIIYVDENGTILSEPPPPIPPPTGEERRQLEAWLKRSESQQTADVPDRAAEDGDDWDNGGQDRTSGSETMRAEAQKQFERAQVETFERATKSNAEIEADFENQLTPEGIEAELSGELSTDPFDKARRLIDEYGTEEGLRRLRELDPEAARRFERRGALDRNVPSSNGYSDDQPPDDSP